MKNKLNQHEEEGVKKILGGLKEDKVSERARGIFVSKLDSLPEKKQALDLGKIKERLYFRYEDLVYAVRNAMPR